MIASPRLEWNLLLLLNWIAAFLYCLSTILANSSCSLTREKVGWETEQSDTKGSFQMHGLAFDYLGGNPVHPLHTKI